MADVENKAEWKRNPEIQHFMLFAAVIGFVLQLPLAYLSNAGDIDRGLRVFIMAYPTTLIVIYIAIRFNKLIPREFGLSKEGLSIRFRKEVKSYSWEEITDMSIQRVRLFEVLALELADGRVDQISSLTRRSRQTIMGYYEKLKTCSSS
ncbi:MAG: hypothetical protein LN416_07460 [Candidatus Thermoplasmatota archaeon]|nr:hypothetical protein [Candidatus Thermoplasmatota archaeon]